VDDALRVGGGEALAHLCRQIDRLRRRQWALRQTLAQGLPLQELEDGVADVILDTDVEQGADVRVVQARDRAGLPLEAGEGVGVFGHALGQDLDRHVTVEPGVAGTVNLTHAPGPDRLQDLVRAETVARGERHRAILAGILCRSAAAVQSL
jgi:hypothetical protein